MDRVLTASCLLCCTKGSVFVENGCRRGRVCPDGRDRNPVGTSIVLCKKARVVLTELLWFFHFVRILS